MNRFFWIIVCACVGLAAHSRAAPGDAPVSSRPDAPDFVSETFAYPIDFVHHRVALLFDSEARDFYEEYPGAIYLLPRNLPLGKYMTDEERARFLELPLIKATKFYVFFGAYRNMQGKIASLDTLAAMGHSNAALQRYAALPLEARSFDTYLWSPDVPFWHSDYTLNGIALPFRSYFILHLSSPDDAHTTVEVIEDEPVVRLADHLNVDAHGTLRDYELREVDPTAGERQLLLSCIRQFIERGVPGRHWFNCHA